MLSNCLKCRKNAESRTPKVARTGNRGRMLLSKCSLCDCVKYQSLLTKEEASGLLRSLGIKTPLSKIPWVGPLFF